MYRFVDLDVQMMNLLNNLGDKHAPRNIFPSCCSGIADRRSCKSSPFVFFHGSFVQIVATHVISCVHTTFVAKP